MVISSGGRLRTSDLRVMSGIGSLSGTAAGIVTCDDHASYAGVPYGWLLYHVTHVVRSVVCDVAGGDRGGGVPDQRFSQRDVQAPLFEAEGQDPATKRKRPGQVTRKLWLLQAHGVIQQLRAPVGTR
jgi:hypothetical protein